MNKMISCIVLTYRNNELLFETLDSIFSQDYASIELIVAEDGAPDFSCEKVERYIEENAGSNIVRHFTYSNHPNIGTVKNLNKAIEMASGKYIKIIAGDDTYPVPNVFSEQVKFLITHPNHYFVFGNTISCDKNMVPLHTIGFAHEGNGKLLSKSKNELYRYLVKRELGLLAIQAGCYKKELFRQIGLFDERLRIIEDMTMEKRIVMSGYEIGYIDHPCVNHRASGGVSSDAEAFCERKRQYYLDLLQESRISYLIDACMIGKTYVLMNRKLCLFRLEMCDLAEMGGARSEKVKLVLKNLLPLCYHAIHYPGSIMKYKDSFIRQLKR